MTAPAPAAPPSVPPAVELVGLRRTFGTGQGVVRAVDGLDLTIAPGEVVAFLGPNGAGKTTTLDIVLGLTEASAGTARVFGRPPREAVAAGRVSAVLQSGGLLRDLSVRETVTLVASTFPSHEPVDDVMARAGISGIAGRRIAKCSGGEQQRVRFALALLPDPDLIVLDEPTAGMDVAARRDFWSTMHDDADAGRTIVFATHYLEEADAFADRIVMVADGRIVADGTTAQIRSRASGRTVTADVDPARFDATVAGLRALKGVHSVGADGTRVAVRATDTDLVARTLLTELGGSSLEITSGSLESAFVSITGRAPLDSPDGDDVAGARASTLGATR
ncbi:ABC transporter ATP-binding protein [Georgenia sp. Z1491]|uniref:ABC transporter ATP-binding protein n=1 Tax=Georgenia sp. Z1491 TaxID=3416707 RepID=UPI003CE7BCD0